MTATDVNGVAVLATEPVESRMKARDGSWMQFKRIVKLLLANGDEVYGCHGYEECGFTADRPQLVMQHLGKAHPDDRTKPYGGDRNRAVTGRPPAELASLPIGELYRLALIGLKAAEWQRRALVAEKKLSDARRAFAD